MLAELGIHGNNAACMVHAPMGLDVGADGAEQVALAAVAEMQAVLNRRRGGSLSLVPGSIHQETAACV